MNNKAQMDLNPIAVLLGGIGAILAWIMAGRMDATIIWKIATTLVTGIACYFLASTIANK